MAKKVTKEQVLEAIVNTQGLITKIQRKLIASTGEHWNWETVQKYVHKWSETEEALKAEKETILDFAEQNINKAIIEEHDLATSKWYLRMKGQERGYVETQEVINTNTNPLRVDLSGGGLTPDENLAAGNVEIPDYGDTDTASEE